MEENPRLLWGYVEVALRPHRRPEDASWQAALNRLFQETLQRLGLPPGPPLSRASCAIRNEHWSSERIAATPRAHAGAEPAFDGTPILVVRRRDGGEAIVDGASRANKIAGSGAPGPHSVVVILAEQPEAG